MVVLVTEEDKLDRELQSTELARIMAASPRPVVFLGYVVTGPHAARRECGVYCEARQTDKPCQPTHIKLWLRTAMCMILILKTLTDGTLGEPRSVYKT